MMIGHSQPDLAIPRLQISVVYLLLLVAWRAMLMCDVCKRVCDPIDVDREGRFVGDDRVTWDSMER